MSFDPAALRPDFPALESGVAYFDGPGGTQTPRQVGEAIARTLTSPLSNRGTRTQSELNAEAAVVAYREAMADFVGGVPSGIVYGRSATQLTYDFSRALAKGWEQGDEIVVSRLDHDSNVRPWLQAAAAGGLVVRWIDFDPSTSEVIDESLDEAITERTRLVAITGASNLIGTMPDVRAISDRAHRVGAHCYVDAVHYAAHELVSLTDLGADFLVCSPYKFLGPHCGALAADPDLLESLHPDKLLPSTNVVPERFELGTLPYELMAGTTAAIDYLAAMAPGGAESRRDRLKASMLALEEHELSLRRQLEGAIASLGDRVVVHSRARRRTPTLLLTFPGRASLDAYDFLSERGINAPAGSFYAHEVFTRLGLADTHALRLGLAPYTTSDDIERVLDALAAFVE